MGCLVWTRLAVVAVLIMVASGNDDGDHVMEGGTLRDSWANALRVKIMGRLGESSPITPSTQRVIDQVAVAAAEMPSMPSRSDAALDLGASAQVATEMTDKAMAQKLSPAGRAEVKRIIDIVKPVGMLIKDNGLTTVDL